MAKGNSNARQNQKRRSAVSDRAHQKFSSDRKRRTFKASNYLPQAKIKTHDYGKRLLRRTVKKIVVTTKHPKQQVQEPVVKRDALRITLRPTECRIRKKYKKKMLKSIAAQIQRSGGNVSSWRKQRAKRRNIIYRC